MPALLAQLGPPLRIGTRVKPYGKVVAVGILDGERYYWLSKSKGREVAMMPATLIEAMA